jgi:hypothetical protein
MIIVDILSPGRKPGDGVVVNNFLPLSRHVWDRDGRIFTDVDRNIFRSDAKLRSGMRVRYPFEIVV